MIKATGFPSAVTTFQLFWLIFGICLIAGSALELEVTSHNRGAGCGQNVTLKCSATLTKSLEIKYFTWMTKGKDLCNQTEAEVECNRTGNNLTVNLFNVMPVDAGIYICKIRATQGAKAKPINITVEECKGSSQSSANETAARCEFSGVYPSGVIHWFKPDANLTSGVSTQEEMDQEGRFNIWSTMKVKKEDQDNIFNCSLWIPSLGKYLSSRVVVVSSGSLVMLKWFCVVVEILMLSLVM